MDFISTVVVEGVTYGFQNSIPSGNCPTPAGTETKVFEFADGYVPLPNTLVAVTFTYANTYGDGSTTYPKVNLSSDYTNIPICNRVGSYASSGAWANGNTIMFYFTGTKLIGLSI